VLQNIFNAISMAISITIKISLTISVLSSPPDFYRDWRGWGRISISKRK
jgi:hypothetical protein